MPKIVILLTGTVKPNTKLFLKRTNSVERLHDYVSAISRYMRATDVKIIFSENSDADLSAIARIGHGRLDLIQVPERSGLDKGKGYGEMTIIQNALSRSSLLSGDVMVIKITGRLFVKNIKAIIEAIDSKTSLFVDLKGNLSFADSRFFICKSDFLRDYLTPQIERVDDRSGIHFEQALSTATLQSIIDGNSWSPIPIAPNFSGFSGTDNLTYDSSAILRFKESLKRRLFLKLLR